MKIRLQLSLYIYYSMKKLLTVEQLGVAVTLSWNVVCVYVSFRHLRARGSRRLCQSSAATSHMRLRC